MSIIERNENISESNGIAFQKIGCLRTSSGTWVHKELIGKQMIESKKRQQNIRPDVIDYVAFSGTVKQVRFNFVADSG